MHHKLVLIVLDYASNLVDIDKAKEYCDKNGLLLIYDAAHSFGSVDNERLVKADATMFSFDPIKTLQLLMQVSFTPRMKKLQNFVRL